MYNHKAVLPWYSDDAKSNILVVIYVATVADLTIVALLCYLLAGLLPLKLFRIIELECIASYT